MAKSHCNRITKIKITLASNRYRVTLFKSNKLFIKFFATFGFLSESYIAFLKCFLVTSIARVALEADLTMAKSHCNKITKIKINLASNRYRVTLFKSNKLFIKFFATFDFLSGSCIAFLKVLFSCQYSQSSSRS